MFRVNFHGLSASALFSVSVFTIAGAAGTDVFAILMFLIKCSDECNSLSARPPVTKNAILSAVFKY
jgi:hypothetical protein